MVGLRGRDIALGWPRGWHLVISSPAGIWSAARREPDLAILVGIVLTLPLELSKQLFPVELLEISRLGMIAGFVALAVRSVRRTLIPVPRSIVLAIIIVIAVAGLSLAATRWPNGIRIEAATATYAVFAFFVAETVRDVRQLRIITIALILSAAFVAAVLLAESVFDFYLWREGALNVLGRRNGTFADPNIASRFLSLGLLAVLAAIAILRELSGRAFIGLMATAAMIGAGQALTQSRAGWLVALVPLVVWVAFVRPWGRALKPVAAALFGFALVLVVNATVLVRVTSTAVDVGDTIGAITDPNNPDNPNRPGQVGNGSVGPPLWMDPVIDRMPLDSVRRYLARAGVAMYLDHPLWGIGIGGFQPQILGPYADFIPADRISAPVSLPHTELIRIAAETGTPGILTVILLAVALARVVWSARRAPPPVARAAGAITLGITSIFVASQFEGRLFEEPYLWLLIGLVAALPEVARRAQPIVPGPLKNDDIVARV